MDTDRAQEPHGERGAETSQHSRIVKALIDAAKADPYVLRNIYVARHLSGHVAEANAWSLLAEELSILDRLDPEAVARDAMRTIFGRSAAPGAIASVLTGRRRLAATALPDRPGIRQLYMARLGNEPTREAPNKESPWRIAAARIDVREPAHTILDGHTGPVRAVAVGVTAAGSPIVASGSDDGSIRLWDPRSGQGADPLLAGDHGVTHLAMGQARGNEVILASSRWGRVQLWDPMAGRPLGGPLTEAHGGSLAFVKMAGVTHLAVLSGSTVRLWNVSTGEAVRQIEAHREGAQGSGLTVVVQPGGHEILAVSARNDPTVRLWNPLTGDPVGTVRTDEPGGVVALTAVIHPNSRRMIAVVGTPAPEWGVNRISVWDTTTGRRVYRHSWFHEGPIRTLARLLTSDRRLLLASGGADGVVRLWDPVSGKEDGLAMTGETDWLRFYNPGDRETVRWVDVYAVAEVPLGDERTLLASGHVDGTVRLWDPNAQGLRGGDLFSRLHIHDLPTEMMVGGTDYAPILSLVSARLRDGRIALASRGGVGCQLRTWRLTDGDFSPFLSARRKRCSSSGVVYGPRRRKI